MSTKDTVQPMRLLLPLLLTIVIPFAKLHAQIGFPVPRLIAYAHTTFDGSDYLPTDSGSLKYSNGRVYNDKTSTFQFDSNKIYVYIIPYSTYHNRIRQAESYDSMKNLMTDLTQRMRLSDSAWIDSLKFSYSYDVNNNMLSRTQTRYDGATWHNIDRYLYTYDAGNNMLTLLYQIWSLNGWQNNYNHAYNYNALNERTKDVYQVYDTAHFIWVNTKSSDFSFNTAKKVSVQKDQKWTGSAWTDSARYSYTYDASNLYVQYKLRETMIGSTWYYDTNIIYSYDVNNDMVSELHQYYWGYPTLWMDSTLLTYTYDAHHNVASATKQNWIRYPLPGAYLNEWYIEYTFNNYHQMTSIKTTTWNNNVSGGFWEPTLTDHFDRYYYLMPAGIENTQTNDKDELVIYPVPARDVLNIDMRQEAGATSIIAIYDMQGKLWNQWHTNNEKEYHYSFPVWQLPSGNYIIHMKGDGGLEVSKIFNVAH